MHEARAAAVRGDGRAEEQEGEERVDDGDDVQAGAVAGEGPEELRAVRRRGVEERVGEIGEDRGHDQAACAGEERGQRAAEGDEDE